jgi:hypothetical protein
LAKSKNKTTTPHPADGDDLSVPPTFPKSFYKLLSQLAVEFNLTRPQIALKALRAYAKNARKERSPFHQTLGSEELAERLTEAASASAKDWWRKVPKAVKTDRARKAAEARWGKQKK